MPVWETQRKSLRRRGGERGRGREAGVVRQSVWGRCGDRRVRASAAAGASCARRWAWKSSRSWLDVYKGRINVVTKKIHDERMQLALASMGDDLKTLDKMGLK